MSNKRRKVLSSLSHFRLAPVGTVVRTKSGWEWRKTDTNEWDGWNNRALYDMENTDKKMKKYFSGAYVIRWGNGQ